MNRVASAEDNYLWVEGRVGEWARAVLPAGVYGAGEVRAAG